MSQLEAGEANIAVGRLARVAAALGVPLAELVREDEATRGPRSAIGLLGLRGAGKSTIGPRIAEALALPFIELDSRIEEAAGLSLAEIFALHGEPYYRRLQGQCLGAILAEASGGVVELPGGIVQNDEAFDLAQRRMTTVWLRAEPDDYMARVLEQGDHRPVANRQNAMEELRSILAARVPFYRRATVTVDTSHRSVDEVVRGAVDELTRLGWAGKAEG
jgi:XRE family aerobic/anaerobic benzoate catabolism transcriptional regulator